MALPWWIIASVQIIPVHNAVSGFPCFFRKIVNRNDCFEDFARQVIRLAVTKAESLDLMPI
jgi:hypothetical protein